MTKKRFQKVNVEVTNICNLQCSFCPEVVRAKGWMDVGLFRSVVEQVAPLTEQVCLHLMGEPLVHPRLGELVEVCHELGVPIFLVSNGVLLKEKLAELLLHPAFRQVSFSLHSFHDNFGAREPATYLERIFAFTEKAFAVRPELYLNYRLWNLASPDGRNPLNADILARVENRFDFSLADTSVNVAVRKSYRVKNRLYLHFDTEFDWPRMDVPVLGDTGTCYGLASHFGILLDGTVVPCCLDKEGNIPLGNIKSQAVVDILDSPRARAMRQGFRERKLVEDLCRRCQYIERF